MTCAPARVVFAHQKRFAVQLLAHNLLLLAVAVGQAVR
jgi:hypothetical protein